MLTSISEIFVMYYRKKADRIRKTDTLRVFQENFASKIV